MIVVIWVVIKMKYQDNDYVQDWHQYPKQTDEEYQQVYNFIRWAKSNSNYSSCRTYSACRGHAARTKKNMGCMFYIEFQKPFHLKKDLITLLNQLKEEYGLKGWTPT